MKYLIVLFLIFSISARAHVLDEQLLSDKTSSCQIHYLTPKSKKLWTIEVDGNYCQDGFVQGFTSVAVKDALDRTVETLHGFFYQGYWFSNFVEPIDVVYRTAFDTGMQNLIFKTGEEKDLRLSYYLLAQATLKDEHYSSFEVCMPQPTLFVAHEPVEDFKQSLFQSSVLKAAQQYLLRVCPEAKKLQILGIKPGMPDVESAFFQADLNLADESVTVVYRTPINKEDIPKPLELRREAGESLLTIPAQKQETMVAEVTPVQEEKQRDNKTFQSAVDLALIARVFNKEIMGETIVYVDHMNEAQQAVVTQPTRLLLKAQTALAAGWYLIQGAFAPQGEEVVIQLISAKSCQKEWCSDED